MRPLVHLALEEITVEGILPALSDPVRAAIYAEIVGQSCTHSCSESMKENKRPIPKSTLSQHFKALREAGLIRGERRGVEMHTVSRCAELEAKFPGLMPAILTTHKLQSERQR